MVKSPRIIEPINTDLDNLASKLMASGAALPSAENSAQSDFLFYGEGEDKIRVFVRDEDVWVTQAALAEIFGVDKSGISRHLKNIFESEELVKDSVVAKIATTGSDGKTYQVEHYNLDAIVSVGFRVNSRKATQFRIWAREILKEYLIKGFAMDDERLKQGDQMFGKDYFDELLKRIRDIRTSERRFYEKIRSIFKECSYDYDPKSPITQEFYAHAQNKMGYAITGNTAAEVIKKRVDHKKPNMGLTTWKNQKRGGKIRQEDTATAKNYLYEEEIISLNRLASQFLDFAEGMAERGKLMSMADWHGKLDAFLTVNEYDILSDYGKVKMETAKKLAKAEYVKFKPIRDAEADKKLDVVVKRIASSQGPEDLE